MLLYMSTKTRSDHGLSDWVDLKQAEHEYPVSRRSFWNFISDGRLPAYRPFGRKVLLRRSEIDKLLAAIRVDVDLDVNEVLDK